MPSRMSHSADSWQLPPMRLPAREDVASILFNCKPNLLGQSRWNFSIDPRLPSKNIAGEVTGHPVAVFQRIDQAGFKLPIDERVLADTDTLLVFGLDHLLSEQEATSEEVAAIREWLMREGTCLLLAPHHDVGFTDDLKQRQMEYLHHGDTLVPRSSALASTPAR